ncbi:cysteine-rich motor neuron 1 protein-like isoform X2 [Malaya genurostris]|uniref:cysteine-rich motor neuron 1 protein-like isoform X2 n=1 Tax=Malaya genurostris TaxID=325434 RepID=UPI0026F37FB6|nr:cysteine-rich motor neuron 1 protein-like isoform X2 [Malaya genurostris]XP_058458052.1 cysteine-rich motor neuron 1 protein-like isoform X2 [Malaya genurostris]XP_058458053.1 cysteine-rich motor neuron 1 protein-like isoform X2 [Malaya genurostris]
MKMEETVSCISYIICVNGKSSEKLTAKFLICCLLMIMNSKTNALKCVCNPSECDVVRSEDCPGKGYIVWDPCRCCKVCARTVGEACGGPGDFSGTCEPHLSCVSKIPFGGSGMCLDLPKLSEIEMNHQKNCSETITVDSGCEIVNRKCKCWDKMQVCKTKSITKWEFSNVQECQLNVANLIRSELEFDEDYTVASKTTSDITSPSEQLHDGRLQIKPDAET